MDDMAVNLEPICFEDHASAALIQQHDELQALPVDTAPSSSIRLLPDEGIDLRAAVDEFESNLIRQALAKTGGNKNKAAQLLRLNRTTLVEMVKRKRLNLA